MQRNIPEMTIELVVSRQVSREALLKRGIRTIQQLAAMSAEDLATIPGIGEKTAPQVLATAQAFVRRQPVWYRTFPGDYRQPGLFLDIRVDPDTRPQKPWGFCWGGLTGPKRLVIVHPDRARERIQLASGSDLILAPDLPTAWMLVSRALALSGNPSFYWGKAVTKHVHYTAPQPIQEQLLNWMVDLHPVVTECVAFPTKHTGLQDIAGYLGARWRSANAPYQAHISYLIWHNHGERTDCLNEAAGYMEDNVAAVAQIWDWASKGSL